MSDTAKLKVLGKIVFHNMMGKAFSQVNISKIEFCPQKIKLKLLHSYCNNFTAITRLIELLRNNFVQ